MDVHKTFLAETIIFTTNGVQTTIKRNGFLFTILICTVLPIGFLQITALTFVWNPQANTGYPFSIFSSNEKIV